MLPLTVTDVELKAGGGGGGGGVEEDFLPQLPSSRLNKTNLKKNWLIFSTAFFWGYPGRRVNHTFTGKISR